MSYINSYFPKDLSLDHGIALLCENPETLSIWMAPTAFECQGPAACTHLFDGLCPHQAVIFPLQLPLIPRFASHPWHLFWEFSWLTGQVGVPVLGSSPTFWRGSSCCQCQHQQPLQELIFLNLTELGTCFLTHGWTRQDLHCFLWKQKGTG